MLQKLLWKANRISSMGVREILYRISTLLRLQLLRKQKDYGLLKPEESIEYLFDPSNCQFDNELLNLLPTGKSFELYGAKICVPSIQWQKDYIQGDIYPARHVSKIQLHTFGDREVKNVLELHRLDYLMHFALRYRISGLEADRDLVLDALGSWLEGNPFPYGMGWVSPTIVAKRVVSVLFVWAVLDLNNLAESAPLRQALVCSLEEHVYFIMRFLSLHSSANNHLTAELVSAFIALKSMERHLTKRGQKLLDRCGYDLEGLIFIQNDCDGKNRESAFGYQYQVADWFFLALLADERMGRNLFSEGYKARLHLMFRFFANSFDGHDNFFDYGDRDNFHVFPIPYASQGSAYSQMLASGAIFFADKELLKAPCHSSMRNTILFGRHNHHFAAKKQRTNYYGAAGHIVSRFVDEAGREIYFHFRSGDFGYLAIAAHSHSDLNSFYLSIDGEPILVDPGTYCYRKDPAFRNYFRSARAHNTVSIGGQDHAHAYGYNHWHNRGQIKGTIENYSDSPDMLSFVSSCAFPDGSIHVRHIRLDKNRFMLEMQDEVHYVTKSTATLSFQLHPEVSHCDGTLITGSGVYAALESDIQLAATRGCIEPEVSGWNSPEFLELVPAVSLSGDFGRLQSCATRIYIKG